MRIRPRTHFSWSQLDCWERDRDGYIKQYILKEAKKATKEMNFGTSVAKSLETGEVTGNPATDLVIEALPKYELRDVAQWAILPAKIEGVLENIPLLSKFDSAKDDLSAIIEYKTGKTPWTQKRADESGQVSFYALVAYLITQKIPALELVWMPTENSSQGIAVKGGFIRISTKRTVDDLLKMMVRIARAWEEIGIITESYIL